ncbi:hypothetical protein IOK49_01465 [Fervidicoccus fontis]|uniref:Uncharacterized protein n=1 Tax=Fervidicoccus fontis TaxID=683846 RepID=A0A843A9J9_9CREN|nr:hypothetical protein [Fervidicoccus fontis]MBE9390754.1 hypothetical protein [Fervidicoccus fontis]PNV81266.1 MAG: hypothetical protein C0179_03560 [Fervidicoccus sp.]
MLADFLGIVGMLLISFAWVTTIKNIPPRSLSGIYSAGSFFLFLYALFSREVLFAMVNLFAVSVSLYQFLASFKKDEYSQHKKESSQESALELKSSPHD